MSRHLTTCLVLAAILTTGALCERCPAGCSCEELKVTCKADADLASIPNDLGAGLKELSVVGNGRLKELPADLSARYAWLQKLEIIDCSLTAVAVGVLSEARRLEYLDLSGNLLEELDEDWLAASRLSLRVLLLRRNRLSGAGKSLNGLSRLESLRLSNNRIRVLHDDSFTGLSSLIDLEVNGNRLTAVESDAFRPLTALTSLIANGNPELPSVLPLSGVPLEFVDLADCGLSDLPTGLPNTLTYFIVSRNRIRTLQLRHLAPLFKLNYFIADDNRISEVGRRVEVYSISLCSSRLISHYTSHLISH